jgi:predicted nuclease of predicted toxin-antitoxin system
MDVHVNKTIAEGLRLRGVDVLRAQEDGRGEATDPELLDRATTLNRVMVTFDTDFLQEARRRQYAGQAFSGIVYSRQSQVEIGQWIEDLELMARCLEPDDVRDRVTFLPLK